MSDDVTELFPVEELEALAAAVAPATTGKITEDDVGSVFEAYNRMATDLDQTQKLLEAYASHPATTKASLVRLYNETISVVLGQMTSVLDDFHNKLYPIIADKDNHE